MDCFGDGFGVIVVGYVFDFEFYEFFFLGLVFMVFKLGFLMMVRLRGNEKEFLFLIFLLLEGVY